METNISPNSLSENMSESRNILEKDFMPLAEGEIVGKHLDNVEPHYFFKGAVFCFIFSLPFWIILFKIIS